VNFALLPVSSLLPSSLSFAKNSVDFFHTGLNWIGSRERNACMDGNLLLKEFFLCAYYQLYAKFLYFQVQSNIRGGAERVRKLGVPGGEALRWLRIDYEVFVNINYSRCRCVGVSCASS
jgi:hypothetical protein